MDIRRTDLTETDVLELLKLHHGEMIEFSPPGTCHVLDLDGLRQSNVEMFAGWDQQSLRVIGAIMLRDGFAEIKSMRAHPDARGTGAGKTMLQFLINRARHHDFANIKLETGPGSIFEAAIGLYRSFGFKPCGAFADYVATDFNVFYELEL